MIESSEPERRCVLNGRSMPYTETNEPEGKTLCGREVRSYLDYKERWCQYEGVFQDPAHAIVAGIESSAIYICEKCADVGIEALRKLK